MSTTNHDCCQNSPLIHQQKPIEFWRNAGVLVRSAALHCWVFGLLLCCTTSAIAQDAADPFDSPLAPLPPQLLDANHALVETVDQTPASETASADALQQEFAKLRGLIDQLHEKDSARAKEIVSTIRKSISKQSEIVQQLVESLPSKRFSSKYPYSSPRFGKIGKFVTRLIQLGEKEQAEAFDAEAKLLEKSRDEAEIGTRNDVVEVHHIAVRQGAALPQDYVDEVDRLTTGFVEVQVEHSAAPIVLLLTAKEPVVWKINAADDTRILAVVIDSSREQKVVGLDGTLILQENDFANLPATLFEAKGTTGANDIESLYEAAITRYSDTAYSGQPIVLGMSNKEWADAYLVSRTEALIEQCQTATRFAQAKQLESLQFRASYTRNIGQNLFEKAIGEFNVAGPVASTLIPVSNGDVDVLDVCTTLDDSQTKEFGLTRDGVLVVKTMKGDKAELIPVPLPEQIANQAYAFQAMTFDSDRGRLVLATRHTIDGVKLFVFELGTGAWSKIGDYDVRRFLGLAYIPREDTIWALAVNKVSGGTDFLQLDDEGKLSVEYLFLLKLTKICNFKDYRLRNWWNLLAMPSLLEIVRQFYPHPKVVFSNPNCLCFLRPRVNCSIETTYASTTGKIH